MTRCLAAILSLLAAIPAAATTTYVLPGAAETVGAHSSTWSSTLWALNPADGAAVVSIGLVPAPGVAAPAPVTRTIGPGEVMRLEHPLALWPGMKAGALTITSPVPLVAFLATQNTADAPKVYGQSLLGVGPSEVIFAGETACIPWVDQRAGAVGRRTNLGAVLLDPGTEVSLRIYDGSGTLRGSTTLSSMVPVAWQAPASQFAGAADLPAGWVEFTVTAGRATGYASVADNATSDGLTVQTLRMPEGPTDLYVAGVARTAGANGTYWTTDLRLFNAGDAEAEATLTAFIGGGQHALKRAVPARGVLELEDVLGPDGFDLGEGIAGAVRVESAAPLLVVGKNTNADPGGAAPGSFSSSLRAVAPGAFVPAGESGHLAGVDQETGSTGTRTNLALLGGPGGSNGTLVLRDALGVEWARQNYFVNHGQWTQKSAAQWFPQRSVPANAQVDVLVAKGSVTGYVSRTDNASGDATCIPLTAPRGCAADVWISVSPWACSGTVESASVPFLPNATYAWTVQGGTLLSDPAANAIDYAVGQGTDVRLACEVWLGPDCASMGTAVQDVFDPPRVLTFWAYPSTINAGESTLLYIAVEDGLNALLEPGGVYLELENGVGTFTVAPLVTTVYELTARGMCLPEDTAQTTVTVH